MIKTQTNINYEIKDKARFAHGLLNVLKTDVNYLKEDVDKHDISKMKESLHNIDTTIQKLLTTIEEIEYIIKQNKEMRSK